MEHINLTTQPVSRETFSKADDILGHHHEKIELYLDRLLWWNKRINLVSRNVPRETIAEHIRHSLLIASLPPFQSASTIVDAGTGGGLPGIPLAISHPDKHFILNDIVSKKCMAMKQMVRKIGLSNVAISDSSIEKVSLKERYLLISKHAFKVNELLEMTRLHPWDTMILYKGLEFSEELQGVSAPLNISTFDLSAEADFYREKALVVIQR